MAAVLEDDAIILGTTPYGERDVVVSLLGREVGRVRAFARGGQGSKKRFPGLQALMCARVQLRTRSSEMLDLVSADVDTTLDGLAKDVRTYALAAYLIEVTGRCVPDGAVAVEVYPLLHSALLGLLRSADPIDSVRAFELMFLQQGGVLPDRIEDDGSQQAAWWRPALGFWSSSLQVLADHVLSAPPGSVALHGNDQRALGRLFALWLQAHHPGPLRSVAFLHQL
jgi:recombinational DNA repair protein (RecF pathway)